MANTDQIRDLSKLNVLVKTQLELALADIKKQGVNPLVVETLRTLDRQKWLYGQGRTKAQCKAKGVPESYAAPKEKVVTSTLNSIHLTGCAVDVVPQRIINGKATAIFDAKDAETKKIINTMVKYGFEAGANWKSFPDSPHFQVKGVSEKGTVYTSKNTNTYITGMIQAALNKKINAGLTVDGKWGTKTELAVNAFRKKHGYQESGSVGTTIIKLLLG